MLGTTWTRSAVPGAGEEVGILLEPPNYFCYLPLHCTLNLLGGNRDRVMENSRDKAERDPSQSYPEAAAASGGCWGGGTLAIWTWPLCEPNPCCLQFCCLCF